VPQGVAAQVLSRALNKKDPLLWGLFYLGVPSRELEGRIAIYGDD